MANESVSDRVSKKDGGILVETKLVEEDMTSFMVVLESFEQGNGCLWSGVGCACRSKDGGWGFNPWKETREHPWRGWCRREDDVWWSGCGHRDLREG
jgi:hypothetical protein